MDEYDFTCAFPLRPAPADHFLIEKPRELVERYIEVIDALAPTRIMELGIRLGGSTAMLSELARPEKLVSVEIAPQLPSGLVRYLERSGRSDTVRPYPAVDQSDRARLAEIVADEFRGRPLDLVIDDASHYYDESTASFESLFPHLRAGGLYIIEDWNWEHLRADGVVALLANPTPEVQKKLDEALERAKSGEPERPPLTRLIIELLVARASSGDVVAEISVGEDWVVIRRGPQALDAATFRVADLFEDHFNLL
jgi:cephalosporin hydroxylase